MNKSYDEQRILIDENVIHVGAGFAAKERPHVVAALSTPDITRALSEAKRELIRQIEHQKSAREPMNNRRLRRRTIRRPSTSWDSEGGAAQREATA